MMIPFVLMMAAEQRKQPDQEPTLATTMTAINSNTININGNSSTPTVSGTPSASSSSATSSVNQHTNSNGCISNSSASNSNSTPASTIKSPNSSSETVIARLDIDSGNVKLNRSPNIKASVSNEPKLSSGGINQLNGLVSSSLSPQIITTSEQSSQTSPATMSLSSIEVNEIGDSTTTTTASPQSKSGKRNSSGRLKNLLLLANHLNPFHCHNSNSNGGHSSSNNGNQKRKCSVDDLPINGQTNFTGSATDQSHQQQKQKGLLNLLAMAQKYFGSSQSGSRNSLHANCSVSTCGLTKDTSSSLAADYYSKSAPVTPVKWAPLTEGPVNLTEDTNKPTANGYVVAVNPNGKLNSDSQVGSRRDSEASLANSKCRELTWRSANMVAGGTGRPSVRFVEMPSELQGQRMKAGGGKYTVTAAVDCGMQTDDCEDEEEEEKLRKLDGQTADLVAKLFKIPELNTKAEGEVPMDSQRFRQYGYKLIDYISNYLDTIGDRRVTPLNIEPGYLKERIQPDAPEQGDTFANIMQDFENHIMCGITHWQHPHFHAYFPAGNAYPSILADMLSDALGCVGFSWAASPAYTELEIIMLDWMGKMIGLPDEFLCLSGSQSGSQENCSKGGGVIQGSASECVLVNLLAARHWAIERLRKKYEPEVPDGMILSKLIGYCSKEAHSCVEKAAMIGLIRMRALDTDEHHSLRGDTLRKAIEADMAAGLEPFIVCATLGTTSCVSFDNLQELGQVCKELDIWLHVDAAYAGSALICPEFKYLMKGIEMASSFNMNPNKWMLINFDCSLMWVKDRFKLTRAFVVDPLYLQHSYSDQAIDYRHWGIPLSRRFRALKLWFVIRNYGVEGLREYIRNHVRLAKLFESYISQDPRFIVTNQVVLGLVCFRLIGSNALNQRLLSMINASGKLHMVPASLNGRYVIRFCVCDQHAVEKDILYAYKCVSEFATELFESIRAGRERIRAISQQNTIDVSSISLHTQQSASADKLPDQSDSTGDSAVTTLQAEAAPTPASESTASTTTTTSQQVSAASSAQQGIEAARQYLLSMRSPKENTSGSGTQGSEQQQQQQQQPLSPLAGTPCAPARSPLIKQVSVQPQQQVTAANGGNPPLDDDELEREMILDSLATLEGRDYDLDLDYEEEEEDNEDDGELSNTSTGHRKDGATRGEAIGDRTLANGKTDPKEQQQMDSMDSRSPVARRWHSRASRTARNQTLAGTPRGEHDGEAEDEVFTLAERRNRMSLRYKREFFVRVVSDPRVYRASISGDINAHASCCSLGGGAVATNKQVEAPPMVASSNQQPQAQLPLATL